MPSRPDKIIQDGQPAIPQCVLQGDKIVDASDLRFLSEHNERVVWREVLLFGVSMRHWSAEPLRSSTWQSPVH